MMSAFHIKNIAVFAIGLAVLAALPSCRCLTCDDDGEPGPGLTEAPWQDSVAAFNERILGLLATPTELHVATESEFIRYGMSEDTVLSEVERRPLVRRYRNLGQPALSPLVFARGLSDIGNSEESVQFSLVQNSGATREIPVDSLTEVPVTLAFGGEVVGAFNRTGTIYLQPVYRRDTRRVALLRFELSYDPTFTSFQRIRFTGLIDLPNVREIDRAVSTVKYLDGRFYVATKEGAYTVDDAGRVERIIGPTASIRDIFRYEGVYYATQSTDGPLFESQEGRTWVPSGIVTDFRLVEVLGGQLVVQELEGWQWQIAEDVDADSRPLRLNEDFPRDNDKYFALARLGRTFYMSIDKQIVRAGDLEAEE